MLRPLKSTKRGVYFWGAMAQRCATMPRQLKTKNRKENET